MTYKRADKEFKERMARLADTIPARIKVRLPEEKTQKETILTRLRRLLHV